MLVPFCIQLQEFCGGGQDGDKGHPVGGAIENEINEGLKDAEQNHADGEEMDAAVVDQLHEEAEDWTKDQACPDEPVFGHKLDDIVVRVAVDIAAARAALRIDIPVKKAPDDSSDTWGRYSERSQHPSLAQVSLPPFPRLPWWSLSLTIQTRTLCGPIPSTSSGQAGYRTLPKAQCANSRILIATPPQQAPLPLDNSGRLHRRPRYLHPDFPNVMHDRRHAI